MCGEVGVAVEVGGELGGCVDDVEGHVAFVVGFPLARRGGVEDCFARGVVGGDVSGDRAERGDLAWVGHDDGYFGEEYDVRGSNCRAEFGWQ